MLLNANILQTCLFPRFTAALDYETCFKLALTCRTASEAWREFVIKIDIPRRLARFYRGVALRTSLSILRSVGVHPQSICMLERLIDVPLAIDDTDEACIVETVYCGMDVRSDEIEALMATSIISTTAAECMAVSRVHRTKAYAVPATRIRSLVPTGNTIIELWNAMSGGKTHRFVQKILNSTPLEWSPITLQHGPRVVEAVDRVLDANMLAFMRHRYGSASQRIIDQARAGHVQALPHILNAFAWTSDTLPRLDPLLFTETALPILVNHCTEHSRQIAAATLLYSAASVLFGMRVRPRTKFCTRQTPSLPAMVDSTNAWKFSAGNGLYLDDCHPLAAPILYGRAYTQFAYEQFRGQHTCALDYIRARIGQPSSMHIDDQAWLFTRLTNTTVVDSLYKKSQETLLYNRKRRIKRAGLFLVPCDNFTLPKSIMVAFSKTQPGLVISIEQSSATALSTANFVVDSPVKDVDSLYPIVLGIVYWDEYYATYNIRWSITSLQLRDEGITYRTALMRLFDGTFTFRTEAVPRCKECGRILRDVESIKLGLGAQCFARKNEEKMTSWKRRKLSILKI